MLSKAKKLQVGESLQMKMNKQDQRAVRLQASLIRGQIECLTSAAKHSPLEMERIMSSVRVLDSVARVIEAFVPEPK